MQRILPSPYRRFLRSWLDAPFAVGAVAPSGRALARLLTREIAAEARVLELGPGTGTVTREILGRGVSRDRLIVIERCSGFTEQLANDFQGITIIQGDATMPPESPALQPQSFDAVVSGLPLVLFSREQKCRLLDACIGWLCGGGVLYQFTYGGRCPIDRRDLESRGLQARSIGFVALNMPPAFVFRIERKETVN